MDVEMGLSLEEVMVIRTFSRSRPWFPSGREVPEIVEVLDTAVQICHKCRYRMYESIITYHSHSLLSFPRCLI